MREKDHTHKTKDQQRRQCWSSKGNNKNDVINPCWTRITEGWIHGGIRHLVVCLGMRAARNPVTTVVATVLLSISLLAAGFFTNFRLELDQLKFVTPTDSYPDRHGKWIRSMESGFPVVRPFYLVFHDHGDNVVHANAIGFAVKVVEQIQQQMDQYSESVCDSVLQKNNECQITSSVTQFWNHNVTLWQEQLKNATTGGQLDADQYVLRAVSQNQYPDGTPVFHELILGKFQGYNTLTNKTVDYKDAPPPSMATIQAHLEAGMNIEPTVKITSAKALVVRIDVPDVGSSTDDLEQDLLDLLSHLQKENSQNNQGDNNDNNSGVLLEYFTMNGYQTEMMRALITDMPLVGVLVVVMVVFTIGVFYDRHDKVHSRGFVGLFSFCTIGLSLWTGYGVMWCLGVPLTTIAIMIPFVVVGVGLDDTFIITGTYFRLQQQYQQQQQKQQTSMTREQERQATLDIIHETLEEVGLSITMTTTTTLLAFLLGSGSSIPAVRWLCWYAAACLFTVYVYQATCFIALIVLDERRVQANRRDLCFWITVVDDHHDDGDDGGASDTNNIKDSIDQQLGDNNGIVHTDEDGSSGTGAGIMLPEYSSDGTLLTRTGPSLNLLEPGSTLNKSSEDRQGCQSSIRKGSDNASNDASTEMDGTAPASRETKGPEDTSSGTNKTCTERFMGWYTDQLLKPVSKIVVIIVFAVYFAGTVYSTTLLHQEFNIKDYIPEDSFMTSFMLAHENYASFLTNIQVYFRNVDQSDSGVQRKMFSYVEELAELHQIGDDAGFFWLRDFTELATSDQAQEMLPEGLNLSDFTFNQQVDLAMSIPQLYQIYDQDIVRDPESGNITASRTHLYLREIDMYSIPDQVDMLMDQRDVSLHQPINANDDELKFFTFDELYFYWELYATVIDELVFTTISCVVAVSAIAFVLIPHWTSVAFVCPLIIMLYFSLMGTMQYCGVRINCITYFIIVMAIGLLVDFLMHILLRYYETKGSTRHEKVKETLETMGASIMLGGFTTWLGVIPLAFSTTKIFVTVFICFLAMVTLGCAVGLILLPVLLSLVGLETSTVHLNAAGNDRDAREQQNPTPVCFGIYDKVVYEEVEC